MLTLEQIAELLRGIDCYGTEDPSQLFGTLAELGTNLDVTGFDNLNEVIGFRIFPYDDRPGVFQLLVTVALPRKGQVVDWECPVHEGEEAELLRLLGKWRRLALDRVTQLWPALPNPSRFKIQ